MAIRITPYSDSSGQLALPTRRLTGLTSQQVANFTAPARAMAELGDQIANVGSVVAKVEQKRQTDEARVNTLENTARIQEEIIQRDEELRRNPIPGRSHTQAMQAWFDERMAHEDYAPVNHVAAQMWREQGIQLRSTMSQSALRYEAQQRIAALGASLDRSVNSMSRSVFMNPELFEQTMQNWETHTGGGPGVQISSRASYDEFGNPVTQNFETSQGNVGLLDPVALQRVGTKGRQAIAEAYLSGLIRDNPLQALQILDGRADGPGNLRAGSDFYGMGWERMLQLRTRAYSAASAVNEAALAGIERELSAHVASLSAGGDGLPQFQDTEMITEAVLGAFGGQETVDYFPQNRTRMENILTGFASNVRVARATGLIVNQLSYQDPQQLAMWSRNAQRVAAGSDVTTVEDMFGDSLSSMAPATLQVISQLPADEALRVVQSVNQQIQGIAQQRATDPVGWAMSSPGYSATHEGALAGAMPTDAAAFDAHVRALDAVYANSGQPAGMRPLLSQSAAATEIANITQARDPNLLVASIQGLRERTGQHFERVWRQLTTMENGLGAPYIFLAAIGNTAGMEAYAAGLLMTDAELRSGFAQSQTSGGVTYDMAIGGARQFFSTQQVREALHSGMSERLPEANEIMLVMERSVAAYMSLNPGVRDASAASRAVYQMMFGPNSRLSIATGADMSAILPAGGRDGAGNVMDLSLMQNNAAVIKGERRITEGVIANVLQTDYAGQGASLIYPGSIDPVMQASTGIRYDQLMETIMAQGQFVLNDDSTGFFITVPGRFGREPLMVSIPNQAPRQLSIPFEMLNRPGWQLEQTHWSPLAPPPAPEPSQ